MVFANERNTDPARRRARHGLQPRRQQRRVPRPPPPRRLRRPPVRAHASRRSWATSRTACPPAPSPPCRRRSLTRWRRRRCTSRRTTRSALSWIHPVVRRRLLARRRQRPSGSTRTARGRTTPALLETDLQSADAEPAAGGVRAGCRSTVQDPSRLTSLTLRMRYDDGFVAYLNGLEVARRNAPGSTQRQLHRHRPARRRAGARVRGHQHQPAPVPADRRATTCWRSTRSTAARPTPTSCSARCWSPTSAPTRPPQYFTTPTPGPPNAGSGQGLVADTKFSVDRGFFDAPFHVAITTATPGATIRYTTDGSPPTATTGNVYTGPITISGTTTLRAAAYKPGLPADGRRQPDVHLPRPGAPAEQRHRARRTRSGATTGRTSTMDPLIVTTRCTPGTIKNDLKAIPSLNISMPWDDWFGHGGIYIPRLGHRAGRRHRVDQPRRRPRLRDSPAPSRSRAARASPGGRTTSSRCG